MKIKLILLAFLGPCLAFSQSIDQAIEKHNSHTVDYISVEDLVELKDSIPNLKLLDTRQPSEYSISHLQDAIFVGYEDFKLKAIEDKLNPEDTIVVYCSIGVRSEDIGEQLQKAGYKHVFNLYGGLFEWVNTGKQVFDQKGNPTDKVHAYDLFWSKYLKKGQKVY